MPTAIPENDLRALALASPRVRRAVGEAAMDKVIIRTPRVANIVTRL